ncbi:hypothetical protein NUW54_g11195 [Trametes sanguinea]|uniref:Uncharacterized protein n=1 Tax=Trametes sanguinea TaxID=158606 RepID=A0ACC1NJT8_9APHY|nr:hypothetical protein NUW54_g11195 [Trametes sanguinea]
MQSRTVLEELLAGVSAARDEVAATSVNKHRPKLLLKIAPDLDESELADIAAAVRSNNGVDGVIVSNTTVRRPAGVSDPNKLEQGVNCHPRSRSSGVEAQRYIGVLYGMGGTASEIAGIRFQHSVDLWSFVQEFAEARLVTERYRQEEQDRVKAAEMRMMKCFPYGPMGGLSPFVPLADNIIEVECTVVYRPSPFQSLRPFIAITWPHLLTTMPAAMPSRVSPSAIEALASLTEQRDEIDLLQAQLTMEVRRILRPLGFGADPTQWYKLLHKVMTSLNREYRHDAKLDIVENARKIRRKEGLDKLVIGILESLRKYDASAKRFSEFQKDFYSKKSQLSVAELHYYEDVLKTFMNTLTVFECELATSRELMSDKCYKSIVQAAGPPFVRAFVRVLSDAKSQRQLVLAARPSLVALVDLHEQRLEIEQRSGALTNAIGVFILTKQDLSAEELRARLSGFESIRAALESQVGRQQEILTMLKVCHAEFSSRHANK